MTNILIVIIILLSCILSFIAGSFFMWMRYLHEFKKGYFPKMYYYCDRRKDEPVDYSNLPRESESLWDDLKNFDPLIEYSDGSFNKIMTPKRLKQEHDMISKLLNELLSQNSSDEEIVNAIKYSMVVIKCEYHKLNWEKAYKDFNIEELKKKYL